MAFGFRLRYCRSLRSHLSERIIIVVKPRRTLRGPVVEPSKTLPGLQTIGAELTGYGGWDSHTILAVIRDSMHLRGVISTVGRVRIRLPV